MDVRTETTRLLRSSGVGAPGADAALSELLYEELRSIAAQHLRRERSSHTLQATALAHEAYLRLVASDELAFVDVARFRALSATVVRHILVEWARAARREKRGGGIQRVTLDEELPGDSGPEVDLLDLDDALRELEQLDPRQARVLELQYFAGCSVKESASSLGVSERAVDLDRNMAKAWLQRRLGAARDGGMSETP